MTAEHKIDRDGKDLYTFRGARGALYDLFAYGNHHAYESARAEYGIGVELHAKNGWRI